jgi:hypothetical protein
MVDSEECAVLVLEDGSHASNGRPLILKNMKKHAKNISPIARVLRILNCPRIAVRPAKIPSKIAASTREKSAVTPSELLGMEVHTRVLHIKVSVKEKCFGRSTSRRIPNPGSA